MGKHGKIHRTLRQNPMVIWGAAELGLKTLLPWEHPLKDAPVEQW